MNGFHREITLLESFLLRVTLLESATFTRLHLEPSIGLRFYLLKVSLLFWSPRVICLLNLSLTAGIWHTLNDVYHYDISKERTLNHLYIYFPYSAIYHPVQRMHSIRLSLPCIGMQLLHNAYLSTEDSSRWINFFSL